MDDDGGVGDQEALDAGVGWCRTRPTTMGVPTWHEAIHLCTLEVGCIAVDRRMIGAGAEAALSTLRTVADTMTREDFPALITEAGIHGEWSSIRVWASQGVKGVFVGEDAPE